MRNHLVISHLFTPRAALDKEQIQNMDFTRTNVVISWPSGSGKSTAFNRMIEKESDAGSKIIIINPMNHGSGNDFTVPKNTINKLYPNSDIPQEDFLLVEKQLKYIYDMALDGIGYELVLAIEELNELDFRMSGMVKGIVGSESKRPVTEYLLELIRIGSKEKGVRFIVTTPDAKWLLG